MARGLVILSSVWLVVASVGCMNTEETASSSSLTANVGLYPPPPSGWDQPRLGCPPWMVTEKSGGSSASLSDLGGDIATTLFVNTDRFAVIERAQLEQLLQEQGLEGIVRPGELAEPSNVRGVDLLLVGKVTNLRIKRQKASSGFGIGNIGLPFGSNIGGVDVDTSRTEIIVEMGVDIRLVDPSTGTVRAAQFSDYKRTDAASAMGVQILGARADSEASIEIDEDSKGQLMRLAIDDAIKKMLPKLDRYLKTFKRPEPATDGDSAAAAE